jgi:type I restriction enzyme M protein
MSEMIDRTHRTLTGEDVDKIASTYHAWRGEPEAGDYEDVPGFCAEADREAIQDHRYILTPGRYVGAAEVEEEGEPFEEKMPKLVARLYEQFDEADVLEKQIRENLEGLGYGD